MKERVFLTGANGYLGSRIAFQLGQQGYPVLGLMRGETIHPLLEQSPVEYCRGDLLDPKTYEKALQQCEVVIHTAAKTAFGSKTSEGYYDMNYQGTKLLLESAERTGIRRFIHASTRGTLGVAKIPEESNEETPRRPLRDLDDYARSKYLAEQEVLKHSQTGGMACIVLSPTALAGSYDMKPTPVGRIILSFLRRETRFYMDGGINLIDVEDAAQAFVSALEAGQNGQIYILGNRNITLYELFKKLSEMSGVLPPKVKIPFAGAYFASFFLDQMSKVLGKDPIVTPKKVRSLYHRYSYCDSKKAVQILGLRQVPLDMTLRKIVQWHSAGRRV